MTNRDLLKEAIADAKAVKEVAIANAKAALEETFAPHLESMFNKQMSELEETSEPTLEEDDFNLEELLRELEEEQLEEADMHSETSEEETPLKEEEEATEEPDSTEETPEGSEEFELDLDFEDMTPEVKRKLEAFIGQVFDELVEKGEVELKDEEEVTAEEEPVESSEEPEEELDGDAVTEYEDTRETAARMELEEARKMIKHLNEELTEVNLLNAKLLYTNKIFKAKNLNENQKVQVLSAFDKADTVREAKLVYETLKEGLTKLETKKTFLQESKSFASKPVGVSPKQPVVEVNPVFERMKKLAGLTGN